ncbi:MAG: SsrA-binding protein [Gemmatimonadetes bacterium]|nr:SsrA-binding protein [Gemmatimonadota bacterium]
MAEPAKDGIKIIVQNRKARHDYETLDTFEAGIALQGTEVKSLRLGKANLVDSYARVEDNEVFLHKAHISEYTEANRFNHDPVRKRKLLLHRAEINRLRGRVEEKGLTLIPLKLYFKRGRAKVELALVRGKREYDRRQDIAKRDARRQVEQALKERTLGRA